MISFFGFSSLKNEINHILLTSATLPASDASTALQSWTSSRGRVDDTNIGQRCKRQNRIAWHTTNNQKTRTLTFKNIHYMHTIHTHSLYDNEHHRI